MNNEERTWLDSDGRRADDEFILNWVRAGRRAGYQTDLVVGTDSHLHGRAFRFITAVCLYTHGHGGVYWYTMSYEPREQYRGNQQYRMFQEAARSIELANFFTEKANRTPVIHIDASPKEAGEFTSAFSDSLKGYVVASGYECVLKPNSWCSSSISDKYTK